MVTDSEHLRVVLDAARAHYDLNLSLPEDMHQLQEAVPFVELMLSNLEKAEANHRSLFEMACAVMNDYGYKPQGVRHVSDPPGLVQAAMTLSLTHLSDACFGWLDLEDDTRPEVIGYDQTNGAITLSIPTHGDLYAAGMPDDMVAIFDVCVMRRVQFLHLTPNGPVFELLPTF